MTAPVPIYTPNPPYSEEARKAGVSGVVEVDIMVDAAGNVQDARVVKPLGHGLDEKALETIRAWRFKPVMHNGVPVGGSMTIQVHFQFSASPSQPATQPSPSATPGGKIRDAAGAGNLAKVKALLKDNPDLVFSKDNDDETPLHWAASRGHKDVAELLLANKAEVNAKDNGGSTPLHAAAGGGHKDVAELLLASKAEVNAKDNGGSTPLHYAAFGGYKDVAQLLLANKAEVDAKDNRGRTPLQRAAVTGHRDVAELLLANKAEVNAKGDDNVTPLQAAVLKGNEDVAKLLRQHGGQDVRTPVQPGPGPVTEAQPRSRISQGLLRPRQRLLREGSIRPRHSGLRPGDQPRSGIRQCRKRPWLRRLLCGAVRSRRARFHAKPCHC